MTEKYTKNILTRESIEIELTIQNRVVIRLWSVCSVLVILFALLMYWIFYLALVTIESVTMKWIVCIILGAFFVAPPITICVNLYKSIKQKNLIKSGEYMIVVRTMQYKSDSVSIRDRRRIPRIEGYLHFEGFNAYLTNSTEYQLASMGDDYYIVHYNNSKNIEMLFPTKMYEYKKT